MTYLDLLNGFHDLLMRSQVSKNGQLLYHTLLMINNKSSWSDWFQRTNVSLYVMMGMSEKGLIEARKELKELGVIDYIPSKKKGQVTKYSVLHCKMYGSKYSLNDSENNSQSDSHNSVEMTGETTDIKRLKNKTKTKTNKKTTNVVQKVLTGDARLDDAVIRFIEFRKEMKKPMTEHAVDLMVKKLGSMSDSIDIQIAILEQSIMNGWTGVFPLKNDYASKKQEKQGKFYNDMEEWLHERQGVCDDSISD